MEMMFICIDFQLNKKNVPPPAGSPGTFFFCTGDWPPP